MPETILSDAGCEYYRVCDECDQATPIGEVETTVDNRLICGVCRERGYFRCEHCEELYHVEQSNYGPGSTLLCDDCYEDDYFACIGCDSVYHNDYYAGDGYCEDCYRDSAESSALYPYEFKPCPVFHCERWSRSGKDGRHPAKTYYGIEIETEAKRGANPDDIAEHCPGPREWYPKYDGSLDFGAELVSHPMTWGRWVSEYDRGGLDWLRDVARTGGRSWDTDTCGMHVHISNEALGPLSRLKLLRFFRDNQPLIENLARRKGRQLNHWAQIDNGPYPDMALKAKTKRGERYTALNLNPRHTVEVRIFRGTLKVDSIMRNLALCVALRHFAVESGWTDINPSGLLRWIESGRGREILTRRWAGDLAQWIRENL